MSHGGTIMQNAAMFNPVHPLAFAVTPPAGSAYGAARTLEAAQPDAHALVEGGYVAAPEAVAHHAQSLRGAFESTAGALDQVVPGSGRSMTDGAASIGELPAVFAQDRALPLARAGEATFASRAGLTADVTRQATELLDHSALARSEAAQHLDTALAGFEPVVQRLQQLGAADSAARSGVLAELTSLTGQPASAGSTARIAELNTKLASLDHTNGAELLARVGHPDAIGALKSVGTGLDMAQHVTGAGLHSVRVANGLMTAFETGTPLSTAGVAASAQELLHGARASLGELTSVASDGGIALRATRQAAEGLMANLARMVR